MGVLTLVGQGVRFGMLLQLAVGPVCLLVLSTAGTLGFWPAMPLVAAVTLVDAFYVSLAMLGAAAVVSKPGAQRLLAVVGGLVLVLFGIDIVMSAQGKPLIPSFSLFSVAEETNRFVQGLVITLSNPLTLLFWGGMFTAKSMENRWERPQLRLFAAGCVLSTALFLTGIAAFGGVFAGRVPPVVIQILNVGVGAALIFFGIRLWLGKAKPVNG